MEGLITIVSILVLLLMIGNFMSTLRKRQAYVPSPDLREEMIPSKLKYEVLTQIKDGYNLMSIEEASVKLIKKRRYWFPLWLLIPMPNAINIIFNSSFLCNIYGVELKVVENEIELSTF